MSPSLVYFFFAFLTPGVLSVDSLRDKWSNSWAVEIRGGRDKADQIAATHEFVNLGQIGSLKDMYHFAKHDGDVSVGKLVNELVNGPHDYLAVGLENDPEVLYSQQQTLFEWHLYQTPNDPIWGDQWPVSNTGQTGEQTLLVDINVLPAWTQGYTGRDVIVGVVDNGVEHDHLDLQSNYDSSNSYDYLDLDDDPYPFGNDSHGTACAGEIGMVRNNGVCGVGVAYNSKIAGLRLIGGQTTDAQDAGALSHNRDNIDIYSNSWGYLGYGTTVVGLQPLITQAFEEGSTEGRNGLGNIFVFAAGNSGGSGGYFYDSCTAIGLIESIYTIPVGSYNENGGPAVYDEKCSAKMTVAYVENTRNKDLQVATLARNNECTFTFDGTSSAAPYVSAVIALTLEANPSLTWRDIQHLIAYTSNSDPLVSLTDDAFTNGAGLTVSHQFGFGAIDADAMVTRAKSWENVGYQLSDTIVPSITFGAATYGNPLEITFTYSGGILNLEHLVVTMSLHASGYTEDIYPWDARSIVSGHYWNGTLKYDLFENMIKRGDLQATITSPSNTVSTLLFKRPFDIVTTEGYVYWPFLSVLHWGENPNGYWTIRIYWTNRNGGRGVLSDASVTIYGDASTMFTKSVVLIFMALVLSVYLAL